MTEDPFVKELKDNINKSLQESTGDYNEVYGTEILNQMNPEREYPRWEKRFSGYHYEKQKCDCECKSCCEEDHIEKVPDKDAIEYDVWVPYEPTLFDLIPKQPWKTSGWKKK